MSGPLEQGSSEISGENNKRTLEGIEIEPMESYFQSIIQNGNLNSRDGIEVEPTDDIPDLIHGESESDDEPSTPPQITGIGSRLFTSAGGLVGKTIIGGAVVENLALVLPKDRNGGYVDVPVLPITVPGQGNAKLLAVVGNDPEQGEVPNIPLLLMPQESHEEIPEDWKTLGDISQLVTTSLLSNTGRSSGMKTRSQVAAEKKAKVEISDAKAAEKDQKQIDESDKDKGEDKTDKVAKGELESYVLSGDIKNLFGIKGLKGKLYKFKISGKEEETKNGSDEETDQKGEEEEESENEVSPADDKEGSDNSKKVEADQILKAKAEKPKKNEEGGSKTDKKDEKEKENEKKEPAREKVKINPQSLSLLGKPLGTLLPFLESDEIKNLPIESLEFTYCEEESGHFFPPGLRLEVDVLLKDKLQWVTDAFRKMFGDMRVPKKLHLSAELGKKRDWSKRPKVEDFVLRGNFTEFGCQTWDILQFTTLGLELSATKAASKKPNDEKQDTPEKKADEEQTSNDDTDKQSSSGPVDDKAQVDTPKQTKDHKTKTQSIKDSTAMLETRLASTKSGKLAKSAPKEDAEENKEKSDGEDKKNKEDKSYNYGFGFFGTVSFIKVPHANSPINMHIRIARDFEIEGKKKDKKDDEKKDNSEDDKKKEGDDKVEKAEKTSKASSGNKNASEATASITEEDLTLEKANDKVDKKKTEEESNSNEKEKTLEKQDKHSDGKHKRMWRVVISCDEWKDIYGVKNVTMKEAELKWSFEQGDFKKTMAFELAAKVKLGAGSFKVKGKISQGDYFVDAEVGDLTLTDIKKIHAQIQGHPIPEEKKEEETKKGSSEGKAEENKKKEEEKKDEEEETQGNEVTFKKLHMNLSRKFVKKEDITRNALVLEGHVTFNGKASGRALLELSTDGFTIKGGLADFKIPDTEVTIQQAQLLIFIAFKHKKKGKIEEKKVDEQNDKEKNTIADKSSSEKKIEVAESKAITDGKIDPTNEESQAEGSVGKNIKKHSGDGGKGKTKRENEFAILGIVKVEEVTISVGFYTARTKGKAKREWLAFGSVSNLSLSELVPGIKEESFNLRLENIALIASSEDREVKDEKEEETDNKDETENGDDGSTKVAEEKDTKKGVEQKKLDQADIAKTATLPAEKANKDTDGAKDEDGKSKGKKTEKKKDDDKKKDEQPAHAGVLETVESYKYPIVKGVQLCATITGFDPLENLNKKKRIEGLVLIIAFTPEGLKISIDLPKHLQVPLHPDVILGDFGASIIAQEGRLELRSTMKLLFDDQDPIRIKGVIGGSAAQRVMNPNDKWINPFKLNDKVVVSKLGVEAGFNYATVCAQGPDMMAFRGAIDVGKDFHADMTLSLGLRKEQVIEVNLSEFNISQLLRLTGEMVEIRALQTLNGGEDFLVFRQIKFMFSTGGIVLEQRYERGIHVRGMMEFFGKKGEFDGQISDDGVRIKGGIDHFNIGGLEVQSARSQGKRATMDIEMTDEKQKILVDGKISFHALELSIFIDACLEDRRLEADILLKFTESILLHLKAKAEIPNSQSLDGAVMEFSAELRPDAVGAVFEAIGDAINTIGKLATNVSKNIRENLDREVAEKGAELAQLDKELQELKQKVDKEVQDRIDIIARDSKERKELEQKLKRLKDAVREAREKKENNEGKINELEEEKEETQRKFDEKIRNKETEYKNKLEETRKKKESWEKEKKRLENQKEASFGDALRDKAEADRSWQWWEKEEENKRWWLGECHRRAWTEWEKPWWKVDRAYVTEWNLKASWAEAELVQLGIRKALDAELRHGLEKIFKSGPWLEIEKALKTAGEKIEDLGNAIGNIAQGKDYEAIQALQRDRKAEIDKKINDIKELERINEDIETKLNNALSELKKNEGRITEREEKLEKDIAKLNGELETRPFENDYKHKLQEHEAVKAVVENIQKKLKEFEEDADGLVRDAKRRLHVLEQKIPTVKLIEVVGSTDVFVTNKPLTFKVEGRWKEKPVHFEVQWAPGWSVSELYDRIGKMLIDTAGKM